VKILDFGLAKLLDEREAATSGIHQTELTEVGVPYGTATYAAPEQARGDRVDARADIFSTGVLLYEMLTGEVPFRGPSAFAIMNDRLLNNPVPPREANPEISPQLQEILYRALERKPENRYASAREFARDLRNPSEVGVAERPELRDWKKRRSPMSRRILFYVILALIPVVIFGLLLLVAMQHK